MLAVRGVEDGLAFEDGVLRLRDDRVLAWRWWGEVGATSVLDLGVRYLQADRPGFGGSTRKPGHGIVDVTDDLVALLDFHGLERVPVIGGSGGRPFAVVLAARHPERRRLT